MIPPEKGEIFTEFEGNCRRRKEEGKITIRVFDKVRNLNTNYLSAIQF